MRRISFFLFLLEISISVAHSEVVKVKAGGVVYEIDVVNGTAAVGQNFEDSSSSENKPQGTLKGDIVLATAVEYNGKKYPVTSLSPYAFYKCNALSSVTIPASVSKIDSSAFNYYLPGLKQINVSPDNQYFRSSDGLLFSKDMKQLYRCPTGRSDTTYIIPSEVESIESGAFSSCKTLKHIVLPGNIKYIKNNAFEFCTFETIVVPENTVEIGDYAFYYCIDLTSLTIPYRVKKIGSKAFSNCFNLKTFICQNEKLTIPSDAFEGCVFILRKAEKEAKGEEEDKSRTSYELTFKDAADNMNSGRYSSAIEGFTSLLEYDKDNADIYINRGYCYLNMQPKDYSKAEADFKKALELDSDNKTALNNLQIVNDHYKKSADVRAFSDEGDRYVAVQDYVQAVTCYAKAISIDETNPVPYANIGFCYLVCQQYAGAIGFFDKALALDPDFRDAIKGREIAKINMINQAFSNAINAYSNSLNNAYNSTYNNGTSSYSTPDNTILNNASDRAVIREEQHAKNMFDMYMRLYEQEQAEADSYFRKFDSYGNPEDLRKAKECQSRANDYRANADIWK